MEHTDHIWNTCLQNDDHPAFGEDREKIGNGPVRNNMGGEKVDLFPTQFLSKYDAGGG